MSTRSIAAKRVPPEQMGAEPSSAAYGDLVRSFGEVAAALRDLDDLQPLLQTVAANLCGLAGVSRCSLFLRDERTGEYLGQTGYGDGSIDRLVRKLTAASGQDGFGREVVLTKQPLIVSNAQQDPRPIRATMRFWNIHSMLGVPMRLQDEVVGLVFLDTENEHATFDEETVAIASAFADLAAAAIAQANTTINLRRGLSKSAAQNKLLQRVSVVDERLGRLSVEGASLSEIAALVGQLTGKPCAIYGDDYQVLAEACPAMLQGADFPAMPARDVWSSPAVAAAVAALDQTRGGVLAPMPAIGLSRRFLLAPISARGMKRGWIALMEWGTRFGPLDPHIVQRAAISVALEMSVEIRAARLESDARSLLLADLMQGSGDPQEAELRAASVGVSLKTSRVLCLIAQCSASKADPATICTIGAALEARLESRVITSRLNEEVALAVELEPGCPARHAAQRVSSALGAVLRELEPARTLVAAISAPVADPADYRRAAAEANQILRCLLTIGEPKGTEVLSSDDLGAGRLLLASLERDDAVRYARDVLGALLSGDRGVDDLLLTLKVFLECSCSFGRAAKQLSLHGNTVRYRMARIEELTGLDVIDDGDAQLAARVALLVTGLTGMGPAIQNDG